MLTHYRYRRAYYQPEPRRTFPKRTVATAVFLLAFAYFFGKPMLRLFGFGSPIERLAALVTVENGGVVNVTLEEGGGKRAENGMKLYPGEQITTASSAHASLTFPDGTIVRLDQNTDMMIQENNKSAEGMSIALELSRGSLWLRAPGAGSGKVTRTVATDILTFTLPPRTEALLSPHGIAVYSAQGAGVTAAVAKRTPVVVGEGQRLSLPQDSATTQLDSDLYVYRSPLAAAAAPFVADSRVTTTAGSSPDPSPLPDNNTLTVQKPTDGETVAGNVTVTGMAGQNITKVKVNGYDAPINADTRVYSQEVSFPDGDTTLDIRVQALDANQNPVAEIHRQIRKGAVAASAGFPAPEITSPAKSGETYRTNVEELIIRGNAPKDAMAIYVNDYKLQLFSPEKGTWSYLGSLALGNMKAGRNVYNVIAESNDGQRSPAAQITIEQGQGDEGVVAQASSASAASSTLNPSTLPQNDPLTPGIIKLTGDAASAGFEATGTGFLLAGETSKDTASVWINGYQLKLFKPGNTFWNYIASPDLGTLKPGENVFRIMARNAEGKILDTLEARMTYRK